MQDISWLIEEIFSEFDFGGLLGLIIAVFAVVGAVRKSSRKNAEAARTSAQPAPRPVQSRAPAAVRPAPAAARPSVPPAAPTAQPPRPVAQAVATPAAMPAAGSIRYVSTEGVELHEPGFHGEKPPRLERVDLGAIRAKENAHTAHNGEWRPPQEEEIEIQTGSASAAPMLTAAQMREAMILKEVLDAPVARRQRMRRTYGR